MIEMIESVDTEMNRSSEVSCTKETNREGEVTIIHSGESCNSQPRLAMEPAGETRFVPSENESDLLLIFFR